MILSPFVAQVHELKMQIEREKANVGETKILLEDSNYNCEMNSRDVDGQHEQTAREEKSNCKVKVILWNVAGLHKVRETWPFLEKFDVVVLQETWLIKKNEK